MSVDFSKNRIRELRIEHGLSQRALAEKTGIKQANISRWEAYSVIPNVLDCWVLSEFFSVSIDFLVGKKEY